MSLFDRGKDFGRQLKKNVGRIRSGQPEVSKRKHRRSLSVFMGGFYSLLTRRT